MQMQTKPQAVPAKQNRMTIASVTRGRKEEPIRALIYGVDKIGKTTFGANAPAPIFIGAESGSGQLDVARFPEPEAWQDVLDAIRTLTVDAHDFKTLVIDSLDWAEPLCWRHICERAGKPDVESFGYGKGYTAAVDEWRVLLAALEKLRRDRGMHIILIGHAIVKAFRNPTGEDFDRYQLKLHEKSAGPLKEWVDALLFASYEVYAAKDAKSDRVRGVDTGARVLHTAHRAAWDAGNRYSLPEEIPLSWPDFFGAVKAGQVADPAALRAAIEAKAKEAGGDLETQTLASMERCGDDASKLAQLNNWLNQKVGGGK